MPRMTAAKHAELESFWRAHLEGWRRSALNQRQNCELHGLPLTRFGNWRSDTRNQLVLAVRPSMTTGTLSPVPVHAAQGSVGWNIPGRPSPSYSCRRDIAAAGVKTLALDGA